MANSLENNDLINKYGGVDKIFFKNVLEPDRDKFEITESHDSDLITLSPYLNKDDLISSLKENNDKTTFLTLNIQSLNAKFDELKIFIYDLKEKHNCEISIICLQETWLSETCDQNIYQLENYTLVTLGHICSKHGGLAAYVHKNYTIKTLDYYKKSKVWEGLFFELTKSNQDKKIIIGNIYRPPKNLAANYEEFTNELCNTISRFNKNYKNIILMGDFNINLLEVNTKRSVARFVDFIFTQSLSPKITLPTRLNKRSATLIDNFFCKFGSDQENVSAGILIDKISDHLPCFLSIELFKKNKIKSTHYVEIRGKVSNAENKFKDYLNQNLKDLDRDTNRNPNNNYNKIENYLTTGLNLFYPKKNVKFNKYRHKKSSWITAGIIKSIEQRNRMYRKLKETPITCKNYNNRKINLKTFNKILKHSIKISKTIYFANEFEKFKFDIKNTWATLNSILNRKKNKGKLPDYLILDGKEIHEKENIANAFNNYFSNIGPSLASKIPANNSNSFESYLDTTIKHTFNFNKVSEAEILSVINSINSKTSSGHDNITTKLLKILKHQLVQPLLLTVNQALACGIFPDKLKIAKIAPLHKKDEINQITNYRPISLLPALSKVFEKIIYNQIYNYFSANNLFFDGQYGFRQKHSTELAALELYDKVSKSLDQNNIPFNIYIDLSKAFDTIDHQILLRKLKYYGFSELAIKLMNSYLTNRLQYVQFDGCNSRMTDSLCGVPQGSILGPLLFLIYVNDIVNSSNIFQFISYADDITLLGNLHNFYNKSKISSTNINNELKKVNNWLNSNKLSINISKSKFMVFCKRKKNILLPELKIDNIIIEHVNSFNFLGIDFNSKLTWTNHINKISNKISRTIGVMNKIKETVPQKILKLIYNSLIYSHLNYGNLLWGHDTRRLFILQKKAVRVICNSKSRSHCDPLFIKLGLLKLKDIFNLRQAKFFFNLMNDNMPSYFQCFKPKINIHNYTTRRNHTYQLPRIRHEFIKKSLHYSMITLVNSLPHNLTQKCFTHSLFTFTLYIKKYFIETYSEVCAVDDCYVCNNNN